MNNRITLIICLLLIVSKSFGQFNTPAINGVIAANEYGSHVNGANKNTSGSVNWYCTWDDTCVYFAIDDGFNVSWGGHALCVYLDVDPAVISNAGTGLDTGATYDQVTPNLVINADAFLFVKRGYKDRIIDSSGFWVSRKNGDSKITDWINTTTNTIEMRVRWDSLGVSARPSRFNWLGFISYNVSGGGCFGQMPSANGNGNTPNMPRYFKLEDTDSAALDMPFSKECYTHLGNSIYNFGPIDIYDFTINSTGDSIVRTAGDWNIEGNLYVENGVVDFDTGNNATAVHGDILIGSSGKLYLSDYPAGVSLKGDINNDGFFASMGSELSLNGDSLQLIEGTLNNTSNDTNNFSSLVLDNPSGVKLLDDIFIKKLNSATRRLQLDTGVLDINGKTLTLDTGVSISGTFSAGTMVEDTLGLLRWKINKNGSYKLPVGATLYSPLTVTFNSGTYASGAYFDVNLTEMKHPNNGSSDTFLNRYWSVNQSGISSFSADVLMEYPVSPISDVTGTESEMYAAKLTSSQWSLGNKNTTLGQILYPGATEFSDFTGGSSWVLLVMLLDFIIIENNSTLDISWNTASEINCSHFELFKVLEGQKNLIASRTGSGTTSEISEYHHNDRNVMEVNEYYLNQVDFDGNNTLYGPYFYHSKNAVKSLYVNDGVMYFSKEQKIQEINLYNVEGRLLEKFENLNGLSHISIPAEIQPQMVFVEARTKNATYLVKALVD
ncbi:hypothetical protein OAD66_04410 [Bacteroidia bacterium]|nr:hypothetical protein [Bacteroidia bacterium]